MKKPLSLEQKHNVDVGCTLEFPPQWTAAALLSLNRSVTNSFPIHVMFHSRAFKKPKQQNLLLRFEDQHVSPVCANWVGVIQQ